MKAHRQPIADNGFEARLANRLECYPAHTTKENKLSYLKFITPTCLLLAILAIGLLGGWQLIISHLKHYSFNPYLLWTAIVSLAILILFITFYWLSTKKKFIKISGGADL